MKRRLPTFISMNITNRCNERCPMCAVWKTPSEELSLGQMEKILRDLRRFGIMVVEVTGGEPFMRQDIFEIFRLLDNLGFLYTVTTNGTLLKPETQAKLYKTQGLIQLAVSVDSLDRDISMALRGTDYLSTLMKNLDGLIGLKLPFPVKINFTMSRMNYMETFRMLEFVKTKGIFLSVFPVTVGKGFTHRDNNPCFLTNETEQHEMAEIFHKLAVMRRRGEPLWEYSRFYELAAEYALGRPIGVCDAGTLYFDLHADGMLAVCIDQKGFANLLEETIESAFKRIAAPRGKRACCSAETPCSYTCTFNLSITADHIVDFVYETVKVRAKHALSGRRG